MFDVDDKPLNYFDKFKKDDEPKGEKINFEDFNKVLPNFKNKEILIKYKDLKKREDLVEEISLKKKKKKGLF